MMTVTELESAVLEKLLAGEHPLLEKLRAQLAFCRVKRRNMTGHGFYTYFDVGDAPSAGDLNLHFGDVVAAIEGMADGAGFELYIENGRLSMLEGYGYDDPWPSAIAKFSLRYNTEGSRDWLALRKIIGCKSSADELETN